MIPSFKYWNCFILLVRYQVLGLDLKLLTLFDRVMSVSVKLMFTAEARNQSIGLRVHRSSGVMCSGLPHFTVATYTLFLIRNTLTFTYCVV